MDEKDCEVLLSLYETKNITKTAEKMYITQPAITKRIQKMEEDLGTTLFLRSKKGIVFTPAGEKIIPYAENILSYNRLIREQVAVGQDTVCGSLNIGSSLNVAHYRLPQVLKTYTNRYPNVDIQVMTGQSRDLYRLLQKNEISIAILRGEYSWDDGMELISSEPMCLVCSEENKGRPLTEYSYIGRTTDSVLTGKMRWWRDAHGIEHGATKFHINDIDTCKRMVEAGLGWCILPKICLEDFHGYVEELTLEDGLPFVRNTYVLYRKPYNELPQARLFLELLKEALNQNKKPMVL